MSDSNAASTQSGAATQKSVFATDVFYLAMKMQVEGLVLALPNGDFARFTFQANDVQRSAGALQSVMIAIGAVTSANAVPPYTNYKPQEVASLPLVTCEVDEQMTSVKIYFSAHPTLFVNVPVKAIKSC